MTVFTELLLSGAEALSDTVLRLANRLHPYRSDAIVVHCDAPYSEGLGRQADLIGSQFNDDHSASALSASFFDAAGGGSPGAASRGANSPGGDVSVLSSPGRASRGRVSVPTGEASGTHAWRQRSHRRSRVEPISDTHHVGGEWAGETPDALIAEAEKAVGAKQKKLRLALGLIYVAWAVEAWIIFACARHCLAGARLSCDSAPVGMPDAGMLSTFVLSAQMEG